MSAARARESERPDRLFCDPLAAALAGPTGFSWLERMELAAGGSGPGLYAVIRTRFFDDFLLDACQRLNARQIVLAAAGMDTRAFRLEWPSDTRIYELDLPDVLEAKDRVIEDNAATATCARHTVAVDLQQPTWPEALLAAGYQPERQSIWLIEGLLFYLIEDAVHDILDHVHSLTATGSLLGLDVMSTNLFITPAVWPLQAALAHRGTPGRFGTNEPETLMVGHGFLADVTQPGEKGANYGRWPSPMLPRGVPGLPRSFFVRARRA